MCGRFNQSSDPKTWIELFKPVLGDIDLVSTPAIRNFNVAPTDAMTMLARGKDGTLGLREARWGLVPSWSKDTKGAARLINARSETVLEKPAFKSSFAKRRCIIPVDNFYDWQKTEAGKQPYGIWGKNADPLMLAGMYAFWKQDDQSGWHISSTILTSKPNAEMSTIHHRMPVVLDSDAWEPWLDPDAPTPELIDLMQPADNIFDLKKVSAAINSARTKGPEALELIE